MRWLEIWTHLLMLVQQAYDPWAIASTQFLLLLDIIFSFLFVFRESFYMHIPGYRETYHVEQTGLSPGDLPASIL